MENQGIQDALKNESVGNQPTTIDNHNAKEWVINTALEYYELESIAFQNWKTEYPPSPWVSDVCNNTDQASGL